ncbi:GntR family transcriptional regulator [Aliicoccus persicus]|uniref:Transcriptional regulator, GntR family n=1 Tax=Aliicoccus persicus TaxID=930138 RepID=A0A662Z5G7_9STAP|nr:GntR family transcriptional regulator [Aliicoccus persicus]SEV91613.1 transcriptional regulator, GntR family [Aliicoccus persicus]
MRPILDESQPIFQQIAQIISNDIVEGHLKEGEKAPSENELSRFYNINRATVRKGLESLVDEGIIYKQRGIGMFVREGAREKLVKERQKQYRNEYIMPLLEEAKRLEMSIDTVVEMIKEEEKK